MLPGYDCERGLPDAGRDAVWRCCGRGSFRDHRQGRRDRRRAPDRRATPAETAASPFAEARRCLQCRHAADLSAASDRRVSHDRLRIPTPRSESVASDCLRSFPRDDCRPFLHRDLAAAVRAREQRRDSGDEFSERPYDGGHGRSADHRVSAASKSTDLASSGRGNRAGAARGRRQPCLPRSTLEQRHCRRAQCRCCDCDRSYGDCISLDLRGNDSSDPTVQS